MVPQARSTGFEMGVFAGLELADLPVVARDLPLSLSPVLGSHTCLFMWVPRTELRASAST